MSDALFIAAVLAGCVTISEVLCRHTWFKHAGTALVVIIVTAIFSNLGVIPTVSTEANPVPVYDGIFAYVAPLGIFWLLLRVNLRDVLKAGLPLLGLFLLGALGTSLGVALGLTVVGVDAIGPRGPAIAGMYAATYTGGSANFNALALHYDIVKEATLYAGATAVDAGLTAVWMAATLAIPRLLARRRGITLAPSHGEEEAPANRDEDTIVPFDLAVLGVLGLACLAVSNALAEVLGIPSILILTVLALALAQLPVVARLRGTAPVAMFALYVFLAVIGALCDFHALSSLGQLGLALLGIAGICIAVHGFVIYVGAALLRLDPILASIASQANIGGGTTALVVARSLGRPDLVLPSVLIGSVGTALGTFIGFSIAQLLAP